jgi:hypothetical protein
VRIKLALYEKKKKKKKKKKVARSTSEPLLDCLSEFCYLLVCLARGTFIREASATFFGVASGLSLPELSALMHGKRK